MAAEKSIAIVLRVVEFSETSCIVSLFTRNHGKISALAKGARRPKSPFESALDVLSICRIVFLHKSSDALDLLTEAKLDKRFRASEKDLVRFYAALYIVELLQSLTEDGQPMPTLYETTETVLFALGGFENEFALDFDQTKTVEVPSAVLRFELLLLRELGQLPSLHDCIICSKKVIESQRVAFSIKGGGILCEQCKIGQRGIAVINWSTLSCLGRFSEPNDESWRNGEDKGAAHGELRGLINHYFAAMLGRRPKMSNFLPFLGMR